MSEKHRNSQQSKASKNSNDPKPAKSKDTSVKREKHHRPEKKVISLIDNLCEVSARLTRILSEANIRLKDKGIRECDTCRTTGEQYKRYLKTIKILEMLVNGVFEKEQINKLDASQKRISKDFDVYILTDIQKHTNMFFRQSRCCDVTIEATVRGVKKNPKFEHNLKCFLVLLQRTVAELILQICFLKSQTELLSKSEQLKKFDVPMMHLKILNFEYTNLTDKIIYLIDFETSSAEYNKKKKFDGYCILCAKEEIIDLLDNLNDVLNCTKRIKLVPKETNKDDAKNSKVCCHRCFPHIHGEVNGNPVVLKFNQPKGKVGSGIQTSPEIPEVTKKVLENDTALAVYENDRDKNLDDYEPKKSTDFVKKSDIDGRSDSVISLTDDPDKKLEVLQPRSADIVDTKTKPYDVTNEIQDLPYDDNASDFYEQKHTSQPLNYLEMKDSDDKFEIQEQYEPPIVKEDKSCNTDETYDHSKNNEKVESQDEEKEIKPTKSNKNVETDDDLWDTNKRPTKVYAATQETDVNSEIKYPDKNIEKKLIELGADTILNTMKPADCCNVNTLLTDTLSNNALPYVISLQSLPLSEKDIEIITQKSKEMSDKENKMPEDNENVDPINLMDYLNEVALDNHTSHEHIYNIYDRETGPYIPSFASLILKDNELQKMYESKRNSVYKNRQNQFIKQNLEIRYFQLENNKRIFNLKPTSVFRTRQSVIVSPLVNNSDLYVNLSTSTCYSGHYESCTSIFESFNSPKTKIDSALKTDIVDRNRWLDESINVVYRRDAISDKVKQNSSEDLMKQLIFLNDDTIKQLEDRHVKEESFDRCDNNQYKDNVKHQPRGVYISKTNCEQVHRTDNQTLKDNFLKSYLMCLINNLKKNSRCDKMISNNPETVADSLNKYESYDCKKNIIQFANIDSADIFPCKDKILYTRKANNTNLCLTIKEVKDEESECQHSLIEVFSNTLINSKLSVLSFVVNEELCNLNDKTETNLEIAKKLKISKFIRQDILEKMNLNSKAETNLKGKCLHKLFNFMENVQFERNQRSPVKKLQKCSKSMEVLKNYLVNNTMHVFNNNDNKTLNTKLIKEDKLRIGFKQAMNNCENIDKVKTSSHKSIRQICDKIPKLVSRCKRKQSIHPKPFQLNNNINRALTNIEKSPFLRRKNNFVTNIRQNSNAKSSTCRKMQSKSKRLINRQKFMNKERSYFNNLRKKKPMKPFMPTMTYMKFNVSLKLPKPKFVSMYYEKVIFGYCALVIKFRTIQSKHVYNNCTIEKYEAIFSKIMYRVVNPKIIHYIVKRPHLTVKKCTFEINVPKCIVVKYETVLKVIRLYPSSMRKVMCNWSGDTQHIGHYSFTKSNMLDDRCTLKCIRNNNKKSVLKSCPEVLRNKFYGRYYEPLRMKNGSPLLLFDKFQSPLTDSKGYPIIVNGHAMVRLNKLGQPISDHLGSKIYDRKGNVYSPNGKQMKFDHNYFEFKGK